jgi:hypothetical protein
VVSCVVGAILVIALLTRNSHKVSFESKRANTRFAPYHIPVCSVGRCERANVGTLFARHNGPHVVRPFKIRGIGAILLAHAAPELLHRLVVMLR